MRALLPCQGLTASEVRLLAELGQTIALSFSELGYTVFTLHPTQQQESHAEPSQQAADTSSATVSLSLPPHRQPAGSLCVVCCLSAPVRLAQEEGEVWSRLGVGCPNCT